MGLAKIGVIENMRDTLVHKLASRFSVLAETAVSNAVPTLARTLAFLNSQPEVRPILEDLALASPIEDSEFDRHLADRMKFGVKLETEKEHAALALFLCSKSISNKDRFNQIVTLYGGDGGSNLYGHTQEFLKAYVKPLFNYIAETVTEEFILHHEIQRMKKSFEWFRRVELRHLLKERRCEDKLNDLVSAHLFARDLNVQREPLTREGRPDFVVIDSDRQVLLESKVFKNAQSKRGLAVGIRQLLDYEEVPKSTGGYLLIFNFSDTKIEIQGLQRLADSGPLYLDIGTSRIFIQEIWITNADLPSSKKGKTQSVIINKKDLWSCD